MAQATSLQPGQIRHFLRVMAATSRYPKRDWLILLLDLTGGVHVTQIARIEVHNVLFPSGTFPHEINVRMATKLT